MVKPSIVSLFGLVLLMGSGGNSLATAQKTNDTLQQGFQNPPNAALPRVWWHWMSGNVTQEGTQLDLDWMKRIGIGGVHIFSGSLGEATLVHPPVPFMSDEWKKIFSREAIDARRSGMEVTIAGSPGWSETGGPWVTPEDAMKKYVWSETRVEGGGALSGVLHPLPCVTGPFQDIIRSGGKPSNLTQDVCIDSVVVAFPTPASELSEVQPNLTSNADTPDLSSLMTDKRDTPITLPVPDNKGVWIRAQYDRSALVSAISLRLNARADIDIQVSDDGTDFHSVFRAPADLELEPPEPQQTYSFTPTLTRYLQILITPQPTPVLAAFSNGKTPDRPHEVKVSGLVIYHAPRVDRFEAKAGFAPSIDFEKWRNPPTGSAKVIQSDQVLDLTGRLAANGTLDWTPPAGQWTVLRIGYSLTGQTNGPAERASTGLEVDKLDASKVRRYMEQYLGLYSNATDGKLGNAGVQNVLTDSWEAGVQNWTSSMVEEFERRRGYSPIRFLPTLAGWVVDDPESSDRFLWDFHRTLQQMLADNHYGTIAAVLHEHHMGYYTEAEGDTPRSIGDGMTIKARSDIPTGEYWYRPFATDPGQPSLKVDLEEAASVAHVYGKQIAASESLTVAAVHDPWSFSPAMLKPVADEIFAKGINRILLHESHEQPFVDKKPGLTLLFFGQYFNRNDTWAEQAKPWVDYLARTSYLLQQGKFVADVAYFYGEEHSLTEIFQHRFNTDVPAGYQYDYINPEALQTILAVQRVPSPHRVV